MRNFQLEMEELWRQTLKRHWRVIDENLRDRPKKWKQQADWLEKVNKRLDFLIIQLYLNMLRRPLLHKILTNKTLYINKPKN